MEGGVDVSIERKDEPGRRRGGHPNTCPSCKLALSRRRAPGDAARLPASAATTSRCRRASASTQLADPGTFEEEAADLRSADPLDFFDLRPYRERLAEAELETGLGEAIVIGARARSTAIRASSRSWTSRSWAARWAAPSARSSRAPARARRSASVPLVSVTASGGARMQEGILSLMQLPKTVCAVEDLHDAGGAMFSVMAHPTTAGVLASFARLGDVIVAEPGALLVVHRAARRPADDAGEAARRLRPRRVQLPLRPHRRDRPAAGAAALPGPPAPAVLP